MTTQTTYQITPLEATALVRRGGTILVETDAHRAAAFEPLRNAAIAIARATEAEVVLFDRSTASAFTDPYPSGPWTADVDAPHGDRPLEADELRPLGREALRRQVARIAADGVTSHAWLARGSPRSALGDAARRIQPDIVLLRGGVPRSILSSLFGPPRDRAEIGGSTIVTVDDVGSMVMRQRSCPVTSRPRRADA